MSRWNWIEDWLLPPAVATLNSAWLGLWVLWSVRAVPPEIAVRAVSPFALGVLLVIAAYLTRWSLYRPADAGVRQRDPRLLLAGAGLVAAFGVTWFTYALPSPAQYFEAMLDWGDFISPAFLGLAACAIMWWRGIALGRSNLPHENLERAFYGGILAQALLFSANQFRPLIAPGEALMSAMAFFATGLGSLSLVSLAQARRLEESQTGHWPAFNRYWLGTVVGVIGSILLAGLFAASLLSPRLFKQITDVFELFVNVVTIAFVIFVGTLVFFWAWVLQPLLAQLAEAFRAHPLQLPVFPTWQQVAPATADFFQRYPALNFARRSLVLVVIAAGLGLLFWLAVRRFGRLGRKDLDETRESIVTRELLLQQLLALFRRKPKAPPAPPPYLKLAGARDDTRLMVRRAYQAMLEWAASISMSRAAGQTPNGYARALARAVPESVEPVELLTEAYIRARYAAEVPSLEMARRAEAAAARLKSIRPATNN